MELASTVRGLDELRRTTLGDPEITIAVLDGPVDLTHPCFDGADLRRVDTLVREPAGSGAMSRHGTHVASLIFGQPGGPVDGVAPRCRGLLLPVFSDEGGMLSQLDLARAIERAVQEGAHVVNVSGGERTPTGDADGMLDNALRLCEASDVLVVAAAGNDGCPCLQVPAARPSVLAVGASDADGVPLPSSNWGSLYREHGVLAAGADVVGAVPGGGTAALSGSSFAAPVVSGVAGLLLSLQRAGSGVPSPAGVRESILRTARACPSPDDPDCARHLAGSLDVSAAHIRTTQRTGGTVTTTETTPIPPTAPDAAPAAASAEAPPRPAEATPDAAPAVPPPDAAPAPAGTDPRPVPAPGSGPGHRVEAPVFGVHAACAGATGGTPSTGCGCTPSAGAAVVAAQLIYALGNLDYDFGTEGRRDAFTQQMPWVDDRAPSPYDVRQVHDFLAESPWMSHALTWVCKVDGQVTFALEAEVPYGMAWGGDIELVRDRSNNISGIEHAAPPVSPVYKVFREALLGQTLPSDDPRFVSRISLPGVLTDRVVRLYNGQLVPLATIQPAGLYTWNEAALVDSVMENVNESVTARNVDRPDPEHVRQTVRAIMDKVYFEFRNLGTSAPDRALNFAATNIFQISATLAEGLLSARLVPQADGPTSLYALDDIAVTKSPFTRLGSDNWVVTASFFDPENERRARVAVQMTLDVSVNPPVTLAPARQFLLGR